MSDPDRDAVRAYYDAYAEVEWDRLVIDAPGRVSFEIHRRFLRRFIGPGMTVLEVGAGPGRFTIELAGLGSVIDVTDLSDVQLGLNREKVAGTSAEASVRSRRLMDICDASALRGLLRVVRPGGMVVASVMSLLGAWRHFLPGVLDDIARAGDDAYGELMRTGDLRHLGGEHICRLFRSSDVSAMVTACGAELVAMSASNWASLADPETVAAFEADGRRWATFLDHEAEACGEPGAWDGGTHILFAARRPLD